MLSIEQYGWNFHFEKSSIEYGLKELMPGRVVSILGYNYHVITSTGLIDALVSGAILHASENENLPKVGDWVLLKTYDDQGIIVHVLPRQTELSRKMPGNQMIKQIIAANVDYAFIVQGLDRDFNIMRLQRYILQVLQCNVKPIIILNKKELVTDYESYVEQVKSLGYTTPVIPISALDADVAEVLEHSLFPEKTYVMIGSSGVGKSTLLNALLGYRLQQEGAISNSNSKGRHTTTHRNLVMLMNGSIIIDTPGMREFGITLDADDIATSVHPKFDELAERCRFTNCTHQTEPGCAILDGLEQGSLAHEVYDSYLKLMKEQRRFQVSAIERKRTNKKFGRMMKEVKTHRRNNKF